MIGVNEPVTTPAPRIPDEKSFGTKIRVVHVPKAATTVATCEDEIAATLRTIECRIALRDPAAMADAVSKEGGRQMDWNAIGEQDRKMAPVLRDLVGAPWANESPTTRPNQ
jgi:hypothetical protein